MGVHSTPHGFPCNDPDPDPDGWHHVDETRRRLRTLRRAVRAEQQDDALAQAGAPAVGDTLTIILAKAGLRWLVHHPLIFGWLIGISMCGLTYGLAHGGWGWSLIQVPQAGLFTRTAAPDLSTPIKLADPRGKGRLLPLP